MRITNHGLLFRAEGQHGWINTHAQVPTVLVMPDRVRIYFAARPHPRLSQTNFVDFDLALEKQLYLHPEPILSLGFVGEFDENGIMPDCVLEKEGVVYLYYSGWQRSNDFPHQNFTGLAISHDGGMSFEKVAENPVLPQTAEEPYSATSCFVWQQQDQWQMYYSSGTEWVTMGDRMEHNHDIKYASSTDGRRWQRVYESVIERRDPLESVARPVLATVAGKRHMFFCHRGTTDFRDGSDAYRLDYATSEDGRRWQRAAEGALRDFHQEWDSQMQAYPYLVEIEGRTVMFYNGNSFGIHGFGYATID